MDALLAAAAAAAAAQSESCTSPYATEGNIDAVSTNDGRQEEKKEEEDKMAAVSSNTQPAFVIPRKLAINPPEFVAISSRLRLVV